jgi:hypothetical protein
MDENVVGVADCTNGDEGQYRTLRGKSVQYVYND